jgi:hypothetical protein
MPPDFYQVFNAILCGMGAVGSTLLLFAPFTQSTAMHLVGFGLSGSSEVSSFSLGALSRWFAFSIRLHARSIRGSPVAFPRILAA